MRMARSSQATDSKALVAWWHTRVGALSNAISLCSWRPLKAHSRSRRSRPALTSSLLHASAATPITVPSCALFPFSLRMCIFLPVKQPCTFRQRDFRLD